MADAQLPKSGSVGQPGASMLLDLMALAGIEEFNPMPLDEEVLVDALEFLMTSRPRRLTAQMLVQCGVARQSYRQYWRRSSDVCQGCLGWGRRIEWWTSDHEPVFGEACPECAPR